MIAWLPLSLRVMLRGGPPDLYRGKTMKQEREDEEKEFQYGGLQGFGRGGERRHRPGLPDRIPEEHVMSQGSD